MPHDTVASSVSHLDAGRLFESAMRRFAGRRAIAWPSGELGYAALHERVLRTAAGLAAHGVGRGDRVLMMFANGTEFIECWLRAAPPLEQRPAMALGEPCAMYFTAGSTGEPKGVLRSHQSVVWGLSMLARRLEPDDVLVARAPMGHTGGSLTGPFAVLLAGGTLVIPDGSDVDRILDTVERFDATRLYVHPTAFAKALLQSLAARPRALPSLRGLQWTAGALPEPVRDALRQRFPHLPLEVTYGMTEASNLATYCHAPLQAQPATDASAAKASNCVGFPLLGGEFRIVGPDGARLGAHAEGEIQVRTATAFDGYWQDAAATRAAVTDDGWLRTGDVGFLDDEGALHLSGRQREIIKTGGLAVHPAEVEQALAEHGAVADAVVFGRPDPDWDEAVVAAVSLHAGTAPGSVSPRDLVRHCRDRLAGYKVPKELHLLPEIPRNASGKADKRGVAALLAAQAATDH
ncbi:AMP-binding protein [Piscinibacter sakaiensis]|uniref:class I adenylate-forming enzyme family protein n=1 Tax=Piscinibacter sakaiensis TaxID=1547922 RepID=UPI00372B627D